MTAHETAGPKPVSGQARMTRRLLAAGAVGITAAACVLLAARLETVRRIENISYDWRVRTQPAASADSPIVLVEINESSIRALAPFVGRWPWPRAVHAAALDYLTEAGARAVAYDVLFGEPDGRGESSINGRPVTGSDSDRAWVESVRRNGHVVLLAEATYEGLAASPEQAPSAWLPGPVYALGSGFLPRPLLQPPFPELAAAALAVGHNYLARDAGSDAARRMVPFVEVAGRQVPSLGVAGALAYAGASPSDVRVDGSGDLVFAQARLPMVVTTDANGDPRREAILRFARPRPLADGTTAVFPTYSFFDLLLSADKLAAGDVPPVPPSALAGKLVFVGATAAGTFDRFSTPFSGGAAGIELHATLAQNLLSGHTMRRAGGRWDGGVTVVSGVLAACAATLVPLVWGVPLLLALVGSLGWGLTEAVHNGVWVAAAAPALALSLAFGGGIAWRLIVEGREKRHLRQTFGRYVSRDVIDQLLTNPALAGLGGTRRHMSVLFSDIRGFTAASEHGTPEAVVEQLNEYFSVMVEVLFRHHGTLDKFVGDMVMGLFGAPLNDPRHADHAVAAALDMRTALDALNRRWTLEGRPTVDIGIGINSGEMIAGNIGSEAIMSYTVIGDAVNLGSRLESLNKDLGTHILISEATRSQLTMAVSTRDCGFIQVKGRGEAVHVHEVLRPAPESSSS